MNPQKLNLSLLRVGSSILKDTSKDINSLSSFQHSSQTPNKNKENSRYIPAKIRNLSFNQKDFRSAANYKIQIRDLSLSQSPQTRKNADIGGSPVSRVKHQLNIPKPQSWISNQTFQSSLPNEEQQLKQNSARKSKIFQTYHSNCESFEQIQLNKAIDKMLKKEIKVKEFIQVKSMHDHFKLTSDISPENIKNSLITPLGSVRIDKTLIPNEKKYRFSQFIDVCKSQLNKKYFEIKDSYLQNTDVIDELLKGPNISDEFERDQCRSLMQSKVLQQKEPLRLQKQATYKQSQQFIQHISDVIDEVQEISKNITQKVDTYDIQEQQQLKFAAFDQYQKDFISEIQKKRSERKNLIKSMNITKVNKDEGFNEVLEQINVWSKERGQLIKKLWKSYRKQLIHYLTNYLNDKKNLNQELINTLDETLTIIEDKSQKLIQKISEYKRLEDSHKELKEVFGKCANLFHQEEDSNLEQKTRIQSLESQIKLWLPNLEEYQSNPDILGSGKVWGMSNDLVLDTKLRDQMLERSTQSQMWIRSDLERLVQNSLVITNDKIECERLNRELVQINTMLMNKNLRCKELKMDLAREKRNMDILLEDLDQEKLKNLDFQQFKHKLNKLENIEKKDKQFQCDLGPISLQLTKLHGLDDGKRKVRRGNTAANLYALQYNNSNTNSPRKSGGIPLDQIMAKALQRHGFKSQNDVLAEKEVFLGHRKNSFSLKSPKKSPTKQINDFKMIQIEELKQEPIPILYREKSQQILQVISSMMTKLVVQPYRQMKDLFLEELLTINPQPLKAGEVAEDFINIILEIHNKDSRIKLLKSFIGLGEEVSFTQPVSQGLVNLLQDTNLAFDDIFTGEIQTMSLELEQAIEMIRQNGKNQVSSKYQRDIIDRTIQSVIRQGIVQLNDQVVQLQNTESVNDYRLIQAINKQEKLLENEEPFSDLLINTNNKVKLDDFLDYLNLNLKLNAQDYIKDINFFFNTYLDKSRRGYISGFELHNLYEIRVKIELPLLIFIKEALNSIIEFDNLLNSELDKVFNKFDISSNLVNKGLSVQTFQQAIKYITLCLPQILQKDALLVLKDVTDILEKRKTKKSIQLEEFIQITKDFEFFENLESLKHHNEQNLKKYQVQKKKSNNQLMDRHFNKTTDQKIKVSTLDADYDHRAQMEVQNVEKVKFNSRKSKYLTRGRSFAHDTVEVKSNADLVYDKGNKLKTKKQFEKIEIEESSESSAERKGYTKNTPQILINQDQEQDNNDLLKDLNNMQEKEKIRYLDYDYKKIDSSRLNLNDSKSYSQRSQQELKFEDSKRSIVSNPDKKGNVITPTFKITTMQKVPLHTNKHEDHTAILKKMSKNKIKQMFFQKLSTPSSSSSIMAIPVLNTGLSPQLLVPTLSLFKNVSGKGNLSITGSKL